MTGQSWSLYSSDGHKLKMRGPRGDIEQGSIVNRTVVVLLQNRPAVVVEEELHSHVQEVVGHPA